MKRLLWLLNTLVLLFVLSVGWTQSVGISSSGGAPDASAGLEIDFTDRGFLPPRLTTAQRDAIASPATGLQVFNSDCNGINLYNGTSWVSMGYTPTGTPTEGTHTTSTIHIVWNWNSVAGATGYKYNTVNDYSTATDVGTDLTLTQNCLPCGTNHKLFVWAYDACSYSAASYLTATTGDCGMTATGGTITCVNNKWIHTFTSSGTFTVTSGSGNVEMLIVAGGGGGGYNGGQVSSGGGGAGGLIYNSSYAVTAQAYSVTVGLGGAADNNGGNSVFDGNTAVGGGAGAWGSSNNSGNAGGSGGGGSRAGNGGAGTAGQGNAGGRGAMAGVGSGGGGGGAGAAGSNASGSTGGLGGAGLSYSISGTAVTYAEGGGGGSNAGYAIGLGGGSANSTGAANTGGGGGGRGGSGGSGVVIFSFVP